MITVNGINIYTFDEMMKVDLSESELYDLFETPSLHYSIILQMFKVIRDKRSPEQIINFCKTDDNWMNKIFWKKYDSDKFEDDLTKVFMNIYQIGEIKGRSQAQWWLTYYGITIYNASRDKNMSF